MAQTAPITEAQPNYGDDPASAWADPVPVPVGQRLVYALGFLAIMLLLDRGIGVALSVLADHSQYRYSVLYAGKVRADIAIVGNSRMENSLFAPEMTDRLGVPVYNLSKQGIGMDGLAVIVADYLERNPAPKMILLEVTAAGIAPGDSLPFFQPFFGRSALAREQLREFSPARYWASRMLHAYRYNGGSPERFLLYLRHDDQHWISPAGRIVGPETRAHRLIDPDLHVTPPQVEAWKRIVALCREKGVVLVPFIAPYLPGAIADRDIKTEFQRALMDSTPDGPPLLDFSRAIDNEDAFSDRVHPNATGAHLLLERMIKDGVFKGVAKTPAPN